MNFSLLLQSSIVRQVVKELLSRNFCNNPNLITLSHLFTINFLGFLEVT